MICGHHLAVRNPSTIWEWQPIGRATFEFLPYGSILSKNLAITIWWLPGISFSWCHEVITPLFIQFSLIFTTDFMGRVNFQRNISLERIPETRPIEKTRKIWAFSLAAELYQIKMNTMKKIHKFSSSRNSSYLWETRIFSGWKKFQLNV